MSNARWAIALVLFVLGAGVFALGADIVIWARGGVTISQFVVTLTGQWPVLTFLAGLFVGLVAGHFWFPLAARVVVSLRGPKNVG